MTRILLFTLAGVLAVAAPLAAQDDDRFRPGEQDEQDDLTPEKAMELLKEARDLMTTAEELLNDSSRGKALETEKELLKKLEELLKDKKSPSAAIMKTVQRMLEKSLEKQKGAVDKITEIIKKAKVQMSESQKPKPGEPQPGSQAKPNNPNSPATKPYDPGRTSPASKFRSQADKTGAWGNLPPRLREAMLHGRKSIDEYPPEFREALKEYMKKLAESDR